MDAFSSTIAVVMAAVAFVSVRSFAEGKRQELRYKIVTISPRGTKGVRGVPKWHNADVYRGSRSRMRNGSPEHQPQPTSYEQYTTLEVMSHTSHRQL
ncbi:hypothetical protein F5Y03DRAFT_395783 [Xylaria venustula]|nr:hypothetical protein F5Y03DRAFT_395783 [Xylaria venustula]